MVANGYYVNPFAARPRADGSKNSREFGVQGDVTSKVHQALGSKVSFVQLLPSFSETHSQQAHLLINLRIVLYSTGLSHSLLRSAWEPEISPKAFSLARYPT
ncbi:hypothetical protein NDU88_000468 [Pleurodeles waltl]|uniref:Uncharacterized protein n=1 Tax=Pleurodeles waltl TaxID=8319 RepID=A0AAV7LD60_PLEWA|nr:hypothetical protein NDU88_000468 [Pleurodeles waltl]